jgi:hypothetical protein
LHAWQGAPAGFLRRDMSPKPAYQTLQRLIKEKWWTRHAATTDEQGRLRFRATLGQHRVTVKTAAGRTVQVDLPVVRDKDNELQVRLSP